MEGHKLIGVGCMQPTLTHVQYVMANLTGGNARCCHSRLLTQRKVIEAMYIISNFQKTLLRRCRATADHNQKLSSSQETLHQLVRRSTCHLTIPVRWYRQLRQEQLGGALGSEAKLMSSQSVVSFKVSA